MKKLFLMLGLTSLMSLSATSAFAECCPSFEPMASSNCGCENKFDDCNKCQTCHDQAEANPCNTTCWEKKRDELYCRLNLDTCQKQQAKNIENAYKTAIDNEKDAIKSAHKCLCEKIQASCLDKKDVRSQEKVLKQEFKQLKKTMRCVDKEFKQILKSDQKSEYRKIKREMKYRVKKGAKYCCKPCKCNK